MWCRGQMRTGARYDAPTQFAITTALLELIKEFGGEKEGLSVQLVNQAIRTAYLTVNSHPVGKISEKADGTARALYTRFSGLLWRNVQTPATYAFYFFQESNMEFS